MAYSFKRKKPGIRLPVSIALASEKKYFICAKSTGCGFEKSPEDAQLIIQPLNRELQEFSKTIDLSWTERNVPVYSWDCWGQLLSLAIGFITFAFLVLGYTSPARFGKTAQVLVGFKKERMSTFVLVNSPYSKVGLWRAASLYITHTGEFSRKSGVVHCLASKEDGIVISASGMKEQRGSKWYEVSSNEFTPVPNRLYKINNLFVKFTSLR